MASSNTDPSKLGGINDINITPFVDVVLVLLVIFMVTAPMLAKNIIGLNLPKTQSTNTQTMATLAIAVTKSGQTLVNGELATRESLAVLAKDMRSKNPDVQAVISADVDARHGDVISVLDTVKTAGIENFAIQVEKAAE